MFTKLIGNTRHSVRFSLNSLAGEISHPNSIRLLRKLVYGWYLINTSILLPAAQEFWGTGSLIPPVEKAVIEKLPFFHLLNQDFFAPFYYIFIAVQLVLLVLGIACIYPRIVSICVYVVTMNLDNKAYVILDGGNNLMELVLFYMIFMDPSREPNKFRNSFSNHFSNTVSNLAFYMVRIQLVMVYFVSGLAKVSGTLWQNGTALYYTLNIDEYSHPIAKRLISSSPLLSVIGSYATLLYQVAFPWLVWNVRIRPWLLAFGTFLHIQISFVMGLFMFGFAIAVCYFSFTTDKAAKKILMLPSCFFTWLKRNIVKLLSRSAGTIVARSKR